MAIFVFGVPHKFFSYGRNRDTVTYIASRVEIRVKADYYDKVSLWLANNLTLYTLGQIADILVKSNIKGDAIANNLYIQKLRFPENSNLKFYHLFKSKAFSGNDRLNILYGIVEALNVDGYTDNSLGIAKTYYRRFGYVKSVEENYVSKFATFKLSFRRRKINTESTFDELASFFNIFNYSFHRLNFNRSYCTFGRT